MMDLKSNHNMVWRGNLFSDLIFTTSTCKVPPSDVQAFLLMTSNNDSLEEILVPCDLITFSENGRPDFHFTSDNAQRLSQDAYKQQLPLIHRDDITHCLEVGARVHHDVLIGSFVSLKLLLLVTSETKPFASNKEQPPHPMCGELEKILHRLRLKYHYNAQSQLFSTDVLLLKSNPVR